MALNSDKQLNTILQITDLKQKHSELEKFVKKYPKFSRGYFELAFISCELDYYEQAKTNYLEYLQIEKKDKENIAIACNNLATLLSNDYFKEYDKGKEYYEKAIQLEPNDAGTYYNLALLLCDDYFKEYDRAKEYYEKAIRLNPNNEKMYYNLADLLTDDYFKEYDKAKEYYEKAILLNPNNEKNYYNFACLLCNDYFKEYKQAKVYYEKAIQIEPQKEFYHNLAVLYFTHLNDKQKSDYYFAKAIELDKNFIFTRKALAKTIKETPYLQSIDIKKVRHLENVSIEICNTEPKHLLLTGKNGSGKTSVLKECKSYLKKLLETPIDELFTEKSRNEIFNPIDYSLRLFFSCEHLTEVRLAYESGVYVVKYLGVHKNRELEAKGVETIEKVELPFVNQIDSNLADKIVAYMVDMDYTRLRAFREKDNETLTNLDTWFTNFLEILKSIDENIVDVVYSSTDNKHNFILKVKLPDDRIIDVKFEDLPDGYKAVFKVVFEIMLQMQSKIQTTYELPGIVMIDEPELFLHISMQKKVMPALTKLFPRIQFIVATHSPFILNSIENAVIYDLEKKIRVENLSGYSYSGIVESYFENDKYSLILKDKLKQYQNLVEKDSLENVDKKKIKKLEEYFESIPPSLALEAIVEYQRLKLEKLTKNG